MFPAAERAPVTGWGSAGCPGGGSARRSPRHGPPPSRPPHTANCAGAAPPLRGREMRGAAHARCVTWDLLPAAILEGRGPLLGNGGGIMAAGL